MATRSDSELVAALVTRVTTLEHLIQAQQAELAQLRPAASSHAVMPALANPELAGATSADAAPPEEPVQQPTTRPSRRALLKLGGAAAAAGVAVVAAGASELGHASTAQAHADTIGFYQAITGAGNTAIKGDGGQGAHGVEGTTDFSFGVSGISLTGHAVHGESLQGGIGVIGISQSGSGIGTFGQGAQYGVRGEGLNGVHGSGLGVGVTGEGDVFGGYFSSSTGYGGYFTGGRAPLYLPPSSAAGAPSANPHSIGELYLDHLATVWICIADGTPGTWVRLTGVQSGAHGGAITYLSTPVRLLDARSSASSGLVNRGPLTGNEIFTFGVAGLGGIPGNAQGLIGNVTILGPSGTGNLSLFPAGGAIPTVASMTFGSPGLFLANGVNVAIGAGGAINLQNQSSGTTPLVLDAVAYVS
jgi:hypothetical protein